MALKDCITKAGKALDGGDAAAIEELVSGGMSESEALAAHVAAVEAELADVTERAVAAGAKMIEPEPQVLNQAAYHGTPHTFDQFSLDHMGAGEGAQAYGWGVYLAENEGVAKEYQSTLSKDDFLVDGKVWSADQLEHLNVRVAATRGDLDGAITKARDVAASDSPAAELAKRDLAVLEDVKARGGLQPNPGNLYTTDVPDDQVAKMLDWDKPLSEQPESVQEALAEIDPDQYSQESDDYDASESGAMIYQRLSSSSGKQAASLALNAAGIPGLRYFDEGSRNKTRWVATHPQGGVNDFADESTARAFVEKNPEYTLTAPDQTRNMVVFDDKIIKITHRDGSPVSTTERADMVRTLNQSAGTPEVFYSQMADVLGRQLNAKGTGAAMAQQITALANNGKFKREELEWSGVAEWLNEQTGTVTKQEVMDYLAANEVDVQDVMKGGQTEALAKAERTLFDAGYALEMNTNDTPLITVAETGEDANPDDMSKDEKDAYELLTNAGSESDGTKYSEYQTPGGENYRELLLTLPVKDKDTSGYYVYNLQTNRWDSTFNVKFSSKDEAEAAIRKWAEDIDSNPEKALRNREVRLVKKSEKEGDFKSSHFDEPNVLAHVRFNERTDSEGKRVLFIEEVQSDWHQAGRKEGYAGQPLGAFTVYVDGNPAGTYADRAEAEAHQQRALKYNDPSKVEIKAETVREPAGSVREAGMVPNAPFKKSWPMLAMKRMIRYAAENGFDKVAWLPGEQQAERYDLSKQVDSLFVQKNPDGTYNVKMTRPGSARTEPVGENMSADKLADTVGKEMASKIDSDRTLDTIKERYFENADLKIGGEGMKSFYDRELPNEVNKYVKKWGAKVGSTKVKTAINTDDTEIRWSEDSDGEQTVEWGSNERKFDTEVEAQAFVDELQAATLPVHALTLTDKMRDAAMQPQTLFQSGKVQKPGREVPSTVDDVSGLPAALDLAARTKYPTGRAFKVDLQNQVNDAADDANVDLSQFTVAVEEYLTRSALAEGKQALKTNANAVGWYNEKVTKALRVISLIHPEIATDPQAKFAFIWALAVTSNGLKVDKNFELAEIVYEHWSKNKTMPKGIGIGTAGDAINKSLKLYNTLIKKHGFEVIEKFMTSQQTVGEVGKFTGETVTGENKTTVVYGAAALGPKIGNGFFMNLYGHFEQLTMDRWLMRTWGRWTGTLIKTNPKQVRIKRAALKDLIRQLTPEQKKTYEAVIKRKMTLKDIDDVAVAINKASVKPDNRAVMNAVGETLGADLRKTGNALFKYLDGQKEAPSGAPERAKIRKVFGRVLDELRKDNPDLTMADYQALLWYPEKLLYESAKSKKESKDAYDDGEAPDYANAAIKLARSKGASEEEVARVVAEVDEELRLRADERAAGARPGEQQALNQSDSDAFKRWSGDVPIIEPDEIYDYEGGPAVFKLFHGTTGDFTSFEKSRANPESDLGAGFYFSNEADDVGNNYAGEGPDLTNKIEREIERLVDDYGNDLELTERVDAHIAAQEQETSVEDAIGAIARQTLSVQNKGLSMPVFVRVQNPAILGGDNETRLTLEEEYNEETDEYGEPTGTLVDFVESLREVASSEEVFDADVDGLIGTLFEEATDYGELSFSRLVEIFKSDEGIMDATDENGSLINSELLRQTIESMGFDAIVDHTVDTKFGSGKRIGKSMEGMNPDTVHVVAFHNTQIKSALGNRGTYDESSNIINQPNRANIQMFPDGRRIINLGEQSDRSSFLHEAGHLFLDMEAQLSEEFGITKNQQSMLDFLGVKAFSEIGTEQHEKWAETFEVYLRDGKAPSVDLQPSFSAFKRWLIRIYQTLMDPRLSRAGKLDDDTRAMFDRLLATQEEIDRVSGDPQYDQFFRSREQAGMTDAQWKAYQEVRARVKDRAQLTVEQKALKQYQRMRTQEWNEELAPMILEEMDNLLEMPIYAILRDIDSGYGMDRAITLEVLGIDKPTGKLSRPGRLVKDGLDPADYAEQHGYKSTREMLDELQTTPSIKEAATEAATARMVDKYGDILNDGTLEQEVRMAMHNEAEAELLSIEIAALNRKAPEIDRQYLRSEATRLIAGYNYKQITPDRFYRAEIKAAQAAAKATDPAEKRTAKIQQLVNHYLYREAVTMREKATSWRKAVKTAQTRNYDTKLVHPEYAVNIRLLATMYEMRKGVGTAKGPAHVALKDFLGWYQSQIDDPNGFVDLTLVDPWLIEALAARKDGKLADFKIPTFDEMTMDQLNGLQSQLKHLRFVGGTLSDLSRAEFNADKAAGAQSIIENGGKDHKDPKQVLESDSIARKTIDGVTDIGYDTLDLLNLVRKLDNRYDATDIDGTATQMFYVPIINASNQLAEMTERLFIDFKAEMTGVHRLGLMRGEQSIPTDDGRVFTSTAAKRVMIALNWGTESNREAVREGYNLTDDDVMRVMATMTPDQLKLVNAIWRINESLWPDSSAAATLLYGHTPPKLDATPFEVNGVKMSGGYQRLYYDTVETEIRDEQNQGGMDTAVMPNKLGALIARQGSGGRPVSLELNNITRAYTEQLHFIAYAPAARRIKALLSPTGEITAAIQQKHGKVFLRAFIRNLDSIMGNRRDKESQRVIAVVSKHLRKMAQFRSLVLSVKNSVQNFANFKAAMDEVGHSEFIQASMYILTNPAKAIRLAHDNSVKMRNRASFMDRDMREQLNQLKVGSDVGAAWQALLSRGFFLQKWTDSLTSYPAWIARYHSELAKNPNDKVRASMLADEAVSSTAGDGSDVKLGYLFHSNRAEHIKFITMFGSWFNNQLQRQYRDSKGLSADGILSLKFLNTAVMTPLVAAVVSSLLVFDGPKEDEEWFAWAMKEYGSFMMGMLPIIRDISSTMRGMPARSATTPAVDLTVKVPRAIGNLVEGDQSAAKSASDVLKIAGTFTPMPGLGNVTHFLDYVDAYDQGLEGDTFNPVRAVIKGRTWD